MREKEKRQTPRFTIRMTSGASAYSALSQTCGQINCELIDISSGGLRARLLNKDTACSALKQESQVELLSFSEDSFDFLVGTKGTIRWNRNDTRQFGLEFNEKIPADQVEAILFHFNYLFGS